MAKLADTTIRLLGQEPLAGSVPTAELLRLAEILDRAGFAYLEVSGGGVFDSAVRRGVESPWERIRAIKARVKTPLGLALRGRFLVGSRPVGPEFAQRFVASAAENGIDVFRLHDPLNDVSTMTKVMEFMAVGKPIVSFDLKEARFSAQRAAVYVPNNDARAFGQAIVELLDDPERRRGMSAAGLERIRTEIGWERSETNLLAAYARVLGSRVSPASAAASRPPAADRTPPA